MNWYNEIDPYAAQWLRNLIDAGELAPGVVDERDIRDVRPTELVSFDECHFFAGVGVWPRAIRDAERNSNRRLERPVWTGSCPCQPFSQAGRGEGFADERHLWPAFDWLIGQSTPGVILGEQVEGADGLMWLDLVFSDLEARGYTCGAAVFPAAGVGAPHIRHRTYFVAQSGSERRRRREGSASRCEHDWQDAGRVQGYDGLVGANEVSVDGLADADSERRQQVGRSAPSDEAEDGSARRNRVEPHGDHFAASHGEDSRPSPTNGFWGTPDWLYCRDGFWRPIEPGSFPLAHGVTARVGRLRAYGNAICLPQATAFIEIVMEVLQ